MTPPIDRGDAIAMLERKLEITLRKRGEWVGWLIVNGKKIIRFSVTPPKGQGRNELSSGAAAKLKLDSKVTKAQLNELIDCTLSRDGYIEILIEQGLIAR